MEGIVVARVYPLPDGRQVLVTTYPGGQTIAVRDDPLHSWGPPIKALSTSPAGYDQAMRRKENP